MKTSSVQTQIHLSKLEQKNVRPEIVGYHAIPIVIMS